MKTVAHLHRTNCQLYVTTTSSTWKLTNTLGVLRWRHDLYIFCFLMWNWNISSSKKIFDHVTIYNTMSPKTVIIQISETSQHEQSCRTVWRFVDMYKLQFDSIEISLLMLIVRPESLFSAFTNINNFNNDQLGLQIKVLLRRIHLFVIISRLTTFGNWLLLNLDRHFDVGIISAR